MSEKPSLRKIEQHPEPTHDEKAHSVGLHALSTHMSYTVQTGAEESKQEQREVCLLNLWVTSLLPIIVTPSSHNPQQGTKCRLDL